MGSVFPSSAPPRAKREPFATSHATRGSAASAFSSPVSDADAKTIVDYLARQYGK